MLLTISTTHQPATDLGYLLHKNPANLQMEALSFGKAYVFYPDASVEFCAAALLLEIDPVALVRGRGPAGEGGQLEQYVNDRPYAANSFLSVAMGRILSTAMSGRSKDRPELAETAIPLTAHLPVIAARGGEDLVKRLFEPLGYTVETQGSQLDDKFPEWGASPYVALTITGIVRLQDLLTHLYVLIPVLDNEKHYWVANDEIEKLLKRGEGWLGAHPEKDLIVSRYLKRQRSLTREALSRLLAEDTPSDEGDEIPSVESPAIERTPSLHDQRLQAVLSVIRDTGAKRVVDLGCGEGKLLKLLLSEKQFDTILGMDVSWRSLETAKERLRLDGLTERQRGRIELIQGSLTYRDQRLNGFEAAAIVEVIEHLDAARLATFERIVFEFARPTHVVLTTPNAEYNTVFETLPAGEFRHGDHRFEWKRPEFEGWANGVAERFGYGVRFEPVGPVDAERGAPTQMAVFTQREVAA
ncbi:3' terminal RNA ribose 2'-O-methyltransferase Hen1 [Granulicella arctica]|uniref:Small RNA 2'-O-methyltransferase n=1 Tax=Granulicella arctica TaxID=940613 RepID=A0A7Y9PH31_9BACT|nr:3' terminal RNA ribose 2'-O-methyltransferase Hen1 [Granulicella arctica]NYF79712.1 3' terminal RNA ribose 2'-O-methyltransferase Hen1 [Granulicella arctica]